VAAQAETFQQRAQQLRARQDLRRRASQMEHDPFSPLEGSKRRTVAITAPGSASFAPGSHNPGDAPAVNGSTSGAGGGSGSVSLDRGGQPMGAGAPPQGSVVVSTPGSAPGPRALVSPSAAPTPTAGGAADTAAPLSVQLRDLLDPATLAEIRRLEASAAPGAGVEALERAAAALRARAARLHGQAQSLRSRAQVH
jgi:hypothetical protein